VDPTQAATLRAELTRLGNDTIFSPRIFPDDPFVDRYIIKPGDTLGKIAKTLKISPDLLAEVNGIANKNLIRAGQTLKTVKGPFRLVVHKPTYTMDVYLDTTFVKHFKVGLGADDSTPTGEWRVATKLTNPTYYPPRGGQIISADDPTNPLGERWIGLEGVKGEAVGQHRYGIHGTIEPETIGRSVSLGCIRLYNEDVEDLYTYLVEQHSIVEVRN
ncbi:MAG: L,D-transpeptidase family protein, partial [Phycisphaerae bacterium]|jgi:lipoprotein-anchoring transpeptidase ErfK/SrfK